MNSVANEQKICDDNDEDAFAVFDDININNTDNTTESDVRAESNNESYPVVDSQMMNKKMPTALLETNRVIAVEKEHSYYTGNNHNASNPSGQEKLEYCMQQEEHAQSSGITILSSQNSETNVNTNNSKNNGDLSLLLQQHQINNHDNKINQVCLEKNSNIRIKRCTRSLEQLPVLLAEYPFATFSQIRLLTSNNSITSKFNSCTNDNNNNNNSNSKYTNTTNTLARCCIGVVSYRGEPKQNSKNSSPNTFAVIRIWNMHGFSPSANEELALLLCNGSFDFFYSKLMIGSVIACVNLSVLPSSSSSSSSAAASSLSPSNIHNISNSNNNSYSSNANYKNNKQNVFLKCDCLYRVHDIEQIRVLGYAAELGTCSAISKHSQERCHNLVNTHTSQYCIYHLHEVKKVARGAIAGGNKNNCINNANNSISANYFAAKQSQLFVPTANVSKTAQTYLSAPTSSASRTAILKQPSFLVVKGNNGLPVHSLTSAHRLNLSGCIDVNSNITATTGKMTGEGIYAGVYRGSALSISNKINHSLCSTSHKASLQPVNCTNNINSGSSNSNYNNKLCNTFTNHNDNTIVHNKKNDSNRSIRSNEEEQQITRETKHELVTSTNLYNNNNKINVTSNSNLMHTSYYPITSVRNITTRGRDVLAAAKQQEDAAEQARLLRRALSTNATIANQGNDDNNKKSRRKSTRNKEQDNVVESCTSKQIEHNHHSEEREQQQQQQEEEEYLEECKKKCHIKRLRQENVNQSNNRAIKTRKGDSCSNHVWNVEKRERSKCIKVNQELISAVKEQCAPISTPSSSSSSSFSICSFAYQSNENMRHPAHMEYTELVIDYNDTKENNISINTVKGNSSNSNCGNNNSNKKSSINNQILTKTLSGHRSALVSTVAKAIRNNVLLPSAASNSNKNNNITNSAYEEEQIASTHWSEELEETNREAKDLLNVPLAANRTPSQAITLLGEMACNVHSVHNSLRSEAEVNRINAQFDKSIAQEKAIELLSSIHEQPINATYCYDCASWFLKALDSCVKARHRLQEKQTVKRFIECEYCHYKTFVLGSEAENNVSRPYRLLPICPRCHERCVWNKGNAAPNYINGSAKRLLSLSDNEQNEESNNQ